MLRRRLVTVLLGALALAGAPLALSTPAGAAVSHPAAVTTVTYDASQAPDLAANVSEAVDIWNSSVQNVTLVASSGSADVTISEGTGGGSYTIPEGLGAGEVYIDLDQAAQYNPTRIIAHELGHIYGLPDNYNGDCSILMSGHSAGTSCQTTHPSAGEAAEVDANFAGGLRAEPASVYQDCFRTPVTADR